MKTAAIAVRDLAAFCFTGGDIGGEAFTSRDPEEAGRIHRRIQRSRPAPYRSEVPVSREFTTEGLTLKLAGRIDGVFDDGGRTVIEEIKTTFRNPGEAALLRDPLHWGQALCYAAMHALENDLPAVDVQLTYCHVRSNEVHHVRETWDQQNLECFLQEAVGRYARWLKARLEWVAVRNSSLEELAFPFQSFRPGQEEIVRETADAIMGWRQLLLQAPTGLGKTMAVIYGSLRALRAGTAAKAFFLTARTTGRIAAEDALRLLRGNGCRLRSVTVTAKRKACFNPDRACAPAECAYARGHYDRVRGAVDEGLRHEELDSARIGELAARHRVCPYELSLDLSLCADVIIGDYNYAFDPRVHLRRFFDERREDYAFLVDEAHNLVDRAREMFSAQLDRKRIMGLRRRVGASSRKLYAAMGGVATALRALGERVAAEGTGFLAEPAPEPGLGPKLLRLQAELRARLENPGTDPLRRELVELLVDVNVFLDVLERFDDSYTACIEITGDDVRYRLFCVDPARRMAEALARSSSTVLFSATLAPCGYFRSVLGLDAGALELTLPSPFPADNFGAIITGGVSTLYRRRQATKAEVARLLADFAGARAGNYIAYFPSYLYLGMVLDEFVKIVPDVRTIIQTVDLSEGERLAFLDQFGVGGGTMVAFALMGGVFGEAIDLPGERLSGAAIVGVGLPGLSPEREVIRRHYEEKEGRGFDYAFRYPGMNRVLQAAGRVVRTETDRGLVLLVDERFQMEQYRSLLPKEWNVAAVLGRRQLIERVTAFWGVDGTARP